MAQVTTTEDSLPFILQGEYFKIEKQTGLKVSAQCVHCPSNALINGALNATSNFLTHLKRKHENLVPEYNQKQKSYSSESRKTPGLSKQRLITPYVKKDSAKGMTKTERLIVNYVVKGMRPLSTVEEPEFIELVLGLNPEAGIMSRATLERRIFERFQEMKQKNIIKLANVDHICFTADAWTCKGKSRSFMGVTVHWIGTKLERNSCAIACKRFAGVHSYDRIASLLTLILQDYKIPVSKIVKAVTDNASNFVKAFQEYAPKLPQECGEESTLNNASNDDDDDEIIFDDLHTILETGNPLDEDEIILPSHHRCASHTLSLLCTANLASSPPKKFKSVMAKCSGMWNKIGRSTKSAEIAKDIFKRKLTTPCATRWNSLYDSVTCLLKVKINLNQVCKKLDLPEFSDADFIFLEEYAKCVQPIAVALDRLQGEKSTFFGELTPTIFTIKRKLEALLKDDFQFCGSIPKTLLEGLESRFASVMLLDVHKNDALLAAMSHPYFKLRWATNLTDTEKLKLRENFITFACKHYSNSNPEATGDVNFTQVKSNDGFCEFDEFNEPSLEEEISVKIRNECLNFFKDKCEDVSALDGYRTVQKIFRKYNTSIPSSAPVERIFNYSGMILNPKRKSMTDDLFEELTLLKVNKD